MIAVLLVLIVPAVLITLLFRSPTECEAEPEEAYACLRFIQRNRIEACYEQSAKQESSPAAGGSAP